VANSRLTLFTIRQYITPQQRDETNFASFIYKASNLLFITFDRSRPEGGLHLQHNVIKIQKKKIVTSAM